MSMLVILHNISSLSFTALSVEHVPEEAPPLVEETALGAFSGNVWCWQIIRPLRVKVSFRVTIAIVACAISHAVPVVVVTPAGTLLENLDRLLTVEERPRTVEHAIPEKIFVDVRVQLLALVIARGHGRSDDAPGCATVHHGHPTTDRATHGVHASHINVVHRDDLPVLGEGVLIDEVGGRPFRKPPNPSEAERLEPNVFRR